MGEDPVAAEGLANVKHEANVTEARHVMQVRVELFTHFYSYGFAIPRIHPGISRSCCCVEIVTKQSGTRELTPIVNHRYPSLTQYKCRSDPVGSNSARAIT